MSTSEAYGVCPRCGDSLMWQSDESMNDIYGGERDDLDGTEIYTLCICANCGANIEIYDCASREREKYPYWKDGR